MLLLQKYTVIFKLFTMRHKIRFLVFIVIGAFLLSACATQHNAQKGAKKRYKNHSAAGCGCKH